MAESQSKYDVIVVGGGPVGLMAANLTTTHGLETLVVEKKPEQSQGSRAIGIMPPSLEIFDRVGCLERVINAGVAVRTARVHGKRRRLGTVSFDRLPGKDARVISIPQHRTEQILLDALETRDNATIERGVHITGTAESDDGVRLTEDGARQTSRHAKFVIACDGDRSVIAKNLGLVAPEFRYEPAFLMGDFEDKSGLGEEAHLFFTPSGAVESFPLPNGMRRWIVQTDAFIAQPIGTELIETVAGRCGHRLSSTDLRWMSPFGIKRRLTRPYYKGRVILCGDAAHVMPPIGGQGMNTGFADAYMAAMIVAKAINEDTPHAPLLERYDQYRARAATRATSRAVLSMTIGTRTGPAMSAFRNLLVYIALHSPLARRIPPHFAMQTIPFGTVHEMSTLLANQPLLQEA